jgi:N-acetylglucosaminyldiphosphoundecaprenol N-acetyl-beta-D-mannosaminyltransferase
MKRRHDASLSTTNICGIDVANLTQDEALSFIERLIEEDGPHYGAVVNAAKIVLANEDAALKQALLDADVVTADGMSIVWASRLLGCGLKQRVTGIDLFERLVERATLRRWPVYFLGASEESIQRLTERFKQLYPALQVAGWRSGYFDRSKSEAISAEIRSSCAVLLFVAMGSPAQEHWIASHLAVSEVHFAMGVGGSFDHLSGLSRRAPMWMQRSGLEWFYRLIREPRRLWRRYLFGNAKFAVLVIRQRLLNRKRTGVQD